MEANIAVVEWSPDGARAYNPATRQTAYGESVAEALQKVGSPKAVGLCVGRRVSFVRESHVPPADKEELRLIVNVQLESLFPAVRSELAFDYEVGTHRYEDGVQTTVCAIKADTLRAVLSDADDADVSVEWVAPTALGATEIARIQGHDDAIVVERSGGFLNLDIVRHGLLVYSRAVIDSGSREERQSEVQRTLAGYGLTSAAVLAVGDTDLGDDVRQVQDGPLQAMAGHTKSRINVELPETVAGRAKRKAAAKSRLALFLWLAVLCVGALVYVERDDAAKRAATSRNNEVRALTGLEDDVKFYNARLTSAKQNANNLDLAFVPAQTPSDVLTVVSNTLPSGAWLTGVTFERGKPLQVRGTAMNGDAVSAYTATLALEDRFRDVQLVFANNAEIEDVPVVHFAITLHVVGNLPLIEDTKGRRSTR